MTWLDIVVLIICIASLVRGYMTGFVMQLTTLVGIILGAIFAGEIAKQIFPHLDVLLNTTVNIAGTLSYVIGFVVILIAVHLIGRIVNSLVKVVLLGTVNRLVGSVFCLGKWILIVSILLNLLAGFDQDKTIVKEDIRANSRFYDPLIEIAQTVIPYLRFENFISPEGDEIIEVPSVTNI